MKRKKSNFKFGKDKLDSLDMKNEKSGLSSKSVGKSRKPNWKGKKTNDIKWHTKNATTVADIMSYPFNVLVGNGFHLFDAGLIKGHKAQSNGYPFLMSFDVDWYLGESSDTTPDSILNVAAANLYAFMRQHNSGSTNYQRSDLFTSVFAGTIDILANIAYIDKLFDVVSKFSNRNRTLPQAIFASCGLDYRDFVDNLANYRAKFNTILAKATSLVMPKEYPIVDQLISIYKDIHIDFDSNTGREQVINIVKPIHHIYDPTGDPRGGRVKTIKTSDLLISGGQDDAVVYTSAVGYPSGGVYPCDWVGSATGGTSMDVLLYILDRQINALITDDDYNTMAGDIMKAFEKYGAGEFWTFQPKERDSEMEISYSEEFLKQLHNCTFLPVAANMGTASGNGKYNGPRIYVNKTVSYTNELTQDGNGNLLTEFTMWSNHPSAQGAFMQSFYEEKSLIDSHEVNPSPEEVLLITRWINKYDVSFGSVATSNDVQYKPKAMSSLIFMNCKLYYINEDQNGTAGVWMIPVLQYNSRAQFNDSNMHGFILKNAVSNRPICYIDLVGTATKDNTTNLNVLVDGEIDNAVAMDVNVLKRSHEVDFASLLNVPFSGSF